MDNQEIFAKNHGALKSALGIILGLFLLSLIFWFSAGTMNQIKEGRYIGKNPETQNSITVSGTGKVYTRPDLALVNFSVLTEDKTVAGAMAENTKKMNAVIGAIKNMGVDEKDLKTTNFYIYPRYEWTSQAVCLSFPCPPSDRKRVLTGYEVSQTIEVKIRDMVKIGDIIQSATDLGANQLSDLQFTVDKIEELQSEARKEAVENAKTKADDLARQLGVKLVRIISFQEGGASPMPKAYMMEAQALGVGGGEAPQIETGENTIEANVSITYEIN